MRMLLKLTKIGLNVNFGISALKYRFFKEKKKLWEPILIGIAILLGFGSVISFLSFLMYAIFVGGKALNAPEMVIIVGFITGQLIVLVFGIFYMMGTFYFSKDMSILLPLPIKPYEVIGSKFAVVMVNEYLTLLPILLPAVIIYGAGTSQGLFYWIKALVLILTAPVIPLILGSLFVLILMRFINVRKSRDLLAVIGGFLGLLIAVGVNFFTQRIPDSNQQAFFKNFLANQSDLINSIGRKFPPSIWATNGLVRHDLEGLGFFLLFVLVSALLFLALLWLGNKIFYKSLLSGQEVTRKRKVLSKIEKDKRYGKVSSPLIALFQREWKIFFRTPIYVMNGLSGMIIGPVLLVMPFVTKSSASAPLFEYLKNPRYSTVFTLAGLGLMLMTSGFSIVATTSISREGQTFWISKMIPVSPRIQILSKVLHCTAISLIGVLATGLVLIFLLEFSILRVVILLLLGIIGAFLLVIYSLMIDVLHPKLFWTNPQEAVKQNLNGLFGLLLTLLILVILAAFSAVLILIKANIWIILPALGIFILLLILPGYFGLLAMAESKYKSIEM